MKYAAAHIAIHDGNTGYTCFSKPPRSVIVSGLIVFPAFFFAGHCPFAVGTGIVLKADQVRVEGQPVCPSWKLTR
jgi:hypothetical protein